MSFRSIGRITSISPSRIIAEVYNSLGSYINIGDSTQFVGEVGSYLSIYEIGRTVICEIIGVEEKPDNSDKPLSKPNSSRLIYISLVGEIIGKHFSFGVSKLPLIYSEVNIISEDEFSLMLAKDQALEIAKNGNTRALALTIGKSIIFPDYDVSINIDKFFGFHFAVLGNTGAGKSNTIAQIIQKIFAKNSYSASGAKFIVIDSNGEYYQSFRLLDRTNPDISVSNYKVSDDTENNFVIPVWALSADDWGILLHATEKTQIPILKRAIEIAKCFYSKEDSKIKCIRNHILASTLLGVTNSSDTSPSKSDKLISILSQFGTNEINLHTEISYKSLYDLIKIDYGRFSDLPGFIDFISEYIDDDIQEYISEPYQVNYTLKEFINAVNFATLYEGSLSSQRIQEYTSTLQTRLQSFYESPQGKVFAKTECKTVDEYVKSLLGNNQIVNIDVSALDDSSSEVIVRVLSKLLLDHLKQLDIKASKPINLLIEEAHRFIKNETNYGVVGYNIFERIAKEGRKFGLLLGISSQRPSELSKTVISQCSNFIVHRIQNPDDLLYLAKMVPYVNTSIIDRLTYLQTGTALVFGSAINLPTLVSFSLAKPPTDSSNAKISQIWYVPKDNKY